MIQASTSIIVLCYNDSQSLPKLVSELYLVLSNNVSQFEIIIVDDGSTDHSQQVIKAIANEKSNIKTVIHNTNLGVGAAFYSGAQIAMGDIIGYIDGDGQYSANDFVLYFNNIDFNDAISGIRVKRADNFIRIIVSFLYKIILQNLFGLTLKDVNSGIKLYKKKSLIKTFPILSTGAFFDAEILVKLASDSKSIKEVPVQHFKRQFGQAAGNSMKSLKTTLFEMISPPFYDYQKKNLNSRLCLTIIKGVYKTLK